MGFDLHGRAAAVFIVAAWVYWVLFEACWGTTPGKRTFGLAVVGGDDGKPSLRQSVVRNLLRVVDGIPFVLPYLLGWCFALGDANRRRIGDHLAGTRVVSRP